MAHIGNSPASYFTAVTTDVFSANGTATAFTLSKYVSNLADLEIVVNNIQQNPYSGSYTVSNNTLTFSEAPLAGSNNIVVTYRQATIGSTIPTPNTVGNNALQRDLLLTGNTVISGVLTASANVNFDNGALFVDGTNNRIGINNTAPTQALTVTGTTSLTGNLTVTGYTTFTGNVDITSSDPNPVNITSTSNIAFLRVKSTNTTSTYSYLTLDSTSSSQGLGYLIKNGNNGGNGLANGSLYLWNDQGTDKGVEFVPSGNTALRTSLLANGSFVVRGALGVGNTTPYMSNWGGNTDSITVGGNRAYGVIHLIGKSATNTAWSSGVGDGLYYMAYDNINSNHCITVNTSGAVALRNGNTNSNGVGIVFPANQSQSSDPNTLDDYEEGTWTPTDASGAGLTMASGNSGRWTKIGRCVFVDAEVRYPATASGLTAIIGGLPFTSSNITDYNSGTCMNNANLNLWSFMNANRASMDLYLQGSTFANPTNAQLSGKDLYISIWYLTAY